MTPSARSSMQGFDMRLEQTPHGQGVRVLGEELIEKARCRQVAVARHRAKSAPEEVDPPAISGVKTLSGDCTTNRMLSFLV